MFAALSEKLMRFSSRFTYRQRFFFWVFLYFSFTPIPAYWILETQDCFASRSSLQLQGNKQAATWFAVFDAFVQYYIEWIHGAASGQPDNTRLEAFKRTVEDNLNKLKEQSLKANEEIIRRVSLFTSGKLIRNNANEVLLLQTIWNEISKNASSNDIAANEKLYELWLTKLTDKIHQIAYDYHIVLQTDPVQAQLSQSIYFSFVRDQLLMARLGVAFEKIKHAHKNDAVTAEVMKPKIEYLQRHFNETLNSLETTYKNISDHNRTNASQMNKIQQQLADCYTLISHHIEKVREDLLVNEPIKDLYLSFVTSENCIGRARHNAFTIFNTLLNSDHRFYQTVKILTYSYLIALGVLLLFFLAYRFLTRHFQQMETYIQGLTKGQFLSITIPHPEEEIGQIALALQNMGKSIENIVIQLESLEEEVARASGEITQTAEGQSNALEMQNKFLLTLDDRIGRIASKTRSLADTMQTFTLTSEETFKDSHGHDAFGKMVNKLSFLKDASNNILRALATVHEREELTRSLTGIMTKISDQASLLALNAAIETLNIAQNVQPFHDTTDKIHTFSAKTSAATLAIKKIVNEMVQSIKLGTTTAQSCINEINVGADRVLEVSGQLNTIVARDKIQIDKFHSVNEMIQKQARMAEVVISSVNSLNSISTQNKSSASQLFEAILALGISAKELRGVVDALSDKSGGINAKNP